MKHNLFMKQTLVLGVLLILVSTGLVQGKNNTTNSATPSTQITNPQPLDDNIIPYLEVQTANETLTFTPTDDTYIANLDPSEINGRLSVLATRNRYGDGNCWECDILVKFDLSSIPPSTPILSATLNLYYFRWGDSNPAGRPLTTYKITSDWAEMTTNYANQPTKASTVTDTENVPVAVNNWMTWTITTDVQSAIDNPGTCFGWEILDETYWGGYNVPAAYFYPKEGTAPGEPFTPYLEVTTPDGTLTFTPTDDTYIANYDPSEINGALNVLATRNRYGNGDCWECDVLAKFDLSSIPPGTQITDATLNLYYYDYGDHGPGGRALTAYKITSDWNEMTTNYNTQPTKASTVSDTQYVPCYPPAPMAWHLTSDVQSAIDNPNTCFGWEIMDEQYWGDYNVPATYFHSKEWVPPAPPQDPFYPYLQVTLTDGTTINCSATDDTYIANYDPSEIDGGLDYLATRNRYGAGSDCWECNILIRFDLSSIPPDTPITKATLNLYYTRWGDSNPAGRPLTAYRITSDWDEMTTNYANQPTKADQISTSSNIPSEPEVGMSWTVTADAQQYIDHPDTNFGWELMDQTYWGYYNVPAAYFMPKPTNYPGLPSLVFGRITNRHISGTTITFEAIHTKVISLIPFSIKTYTDHQTITINRLHLGMISRHFILASCRMT
jgi:hypothetical protein